MRLLLSCVVCVCAVEAVQAAQPGREVDVVARVEVDARATLRERAEQARWGDPQFEVVAQDVTPGRRPDGPLTCAHPVSVEPLDTRFVTRMRWAVICADSPGWRREVAVKARVSAQVLVMTDDVALGQPVAADRLRLERRDVSATPDALSDAEAVVGRTGRNTLHAGQMLAKRLLQAPVLVQRGQAVGIQATQAGIAVTVSGEALDSGREGDVVRVRNTRSGKVIRARVLSAEVVEPQVMGATAMPDHSRSERD